MLPAVLWLIYAVPAYVLWPVAFRLRYKRTAIAEAFPPRNLYDWFDFALGLSLLSYSAWIVLGPRPDRAAAVSLPGGIAVWASGCLLRIWAVYTLGPHWRIGQDEKDTTTVHVKTGPYRIMDHPINTGLILVAIGQALMVGLEARTIFLLTIALVYFLAQAGAEKRYWSRRKKEQPEEPHAETPATPGELRRGAEGSATDVTDSTDKDKASNP